MPEQRMQKKTPRFADAQRGPGGWGGGKPSENSEKADEDGDDEWGIVVLVYLWRHSLRNACSLVAWQAATQPSCCVLPHSL